MRKLSAIAISVVMVLSFAFIAASAPYKGWNFYFGNLHAHTSYSDGMGTPTDAYGQVSKP